MTHASDKTKTIRHALAAMALAVSTQAISQTINTPEGVVDCSKENSAWCKSAIGNGLPNATNARWRASCEAALILTGEQDEMMPIYVDSYQTKPIRIEDTTSQDKPFRITLKSPQPIVVWFSPHPCNEPENTKSQCQGVLEPHIEQGIEFASAGTCNTGPEKHLYLHLRNLNKTPVMVRWRREALPQETPLSTPERKDP